MVQEGKRTIMTEKDLRRLKRAELLEMLIAQSKEMEELREQMEEMQKKLDDRQIRLNRAGSIAEASLQVNGVFEAAQGAAQQYLENIKMLSERQEQVCAEMERKTRERCEAMEREAQKNVEERWAELSGRLEEFYNAHRGLQELLQMAGKIQTEP